MDDKGKHKGQEKKEDVSCILLYLFLNITASNYNHQINIVS